MKRIIALLLVAVLALSLMACGAPKDDTPKVKAEDIVGTWVMGNMKQIFNADGTGTLSDRAAVLLERTLEISDETNGALDPTVYPLSQLWGFPTKDYRQPTEAEINAALPHVGW